MSARFFVPLKEQYRTGIKRHSSIKEVNTGIYTIMYKFKNPIIEIANLLFSVELSESETKLLTKSFKNNKKFRESLKLNKDDISSVVYAVKIVSKHRQEEE
jgi:hypothetical protein